MDSTSALDSVLTQAELASMVMLDIDPAELAVDRPVNDAHVQQIIDSLPAHGNQIVFPPYVWLHKHLIIDGLHRVVAAYRGHSVYSHYPGRCIRNALLGFANHGCQAASPD